ncbi:hypothetical protein, partial [Phascolarctobacterium faecium]|uniref:hypothetical protein n=1 Tax=Phascolarctobacterium faecium TaxID=33025 RepID=UPI003AF446A6
MAATGCSRRLALAGRRLLFTRDCPTFIPHLPPLTSGHCSAISPLQICCQQKKQWRYGNNIHTDIVFIYSVEVLIIII